MFDAVKAVTVKLKAVPPVADAGADTAKWVAGGTAQTAAGVSAPMQAATTMPISARMPAVRRPPLSRNRSPLDRHDFAYAQNIKPRPHKLLVITELCVISAELCVISATDDVAALCARIDVS